jgi:DNA modification methylase
MTQRSDAPGVELGYIAEGLRGLAVPVGELHEDPANVRRGHAVDRIAASLTAYGQRKPVVANRAQGGKIEAGNGTYRAAKGLGWSHIAVVWVEDDPATAAGYGIADNRLGDLSEWDLEGLAETVQSLEDVFTGFTALELDELLPSQAGKGEDPGPQVDRAEELRAKWGVEAGQVWQLGDHRLICGDCTDPETVRRGMDGEQADYILTDPPYCSGGFQESGRSRGSVGTTAVHKQIAADTLSTRGYMALIKAMLSAADTSAAYVFTDWRMWVNLFDAVESSGFGVRQMIVWDKETPGMGHGWRAQHELILFALKGTISFDKFSHAQGNVIQAQRTGNKEHTTEKPVEVLETIIGVMQDMRVVYDPFCGSGTTIIACERLGRRARCIEIEPGYVAVCLERFYQMTGKTPVLLAHSSSGEAVDNAA